MYESCEQISYNVTFGLKGLWIMNYETRIALYGGVFRFLYYLSYVLMC